MTYYRLIDQHGEIVAENISAIEVAKLFDVNPKTVRTHASTGRLLKKEFRIETVDTQRVGEPSGIPESLWKEFDAVCAGLKQFDLSHIGFRKKGDV